VLFDCGDQQSGILGTFGEHFVVRDDLVLGLLHFTRLPNSFGLLAFPLRMISVCGSKTLRILLGCWVIPCNTPALVCRMTCCTRSPMVSKISRSGFSRPCRGLGRSRISSRTPPACCTIFRVRLTSSRYRWIRRSSTFRSFQPPCQGDGHHLLVRATNSVADVAVCSRCLL
jgi:hypothetical protein